jgi:sulfite reductase alpha subunit-like flavoprotein
LDSNKNTNIHSNTNVKQNLNSPSVFTRDSPFLASVISARLLSTLDNSVKTCFEIGVDISKSGMTHLAGDCYGIIVENREEDVNELLAILKLNGNQLISISSKNGIGKHNKQKNKKCQHEHKYEHTNKQAQ